MGRLSFLSGSNRGTLLWLGIITFFLLIVVNGIVFSEEDHDRAKILREQGEILPLPEILEKAQKEHPGKMLEVELEKEAGIIIYELEFLDDKGRVWELKYDAKTGVLLSSEEEK